MATSRRPEAAFAEHALALTAGAWTELGVSGWTSTHSDWAIDPEPLILFTASLGDADPRLRDEALDWCIRNGRQVSKARLRNLLRAQPDEVQESFGEFAAIVGAHSGLLWPGATAPRRYTVTGRSAQPQLDRPSLAWLRLRAMFGVSARAEILRCFLSADSRALGIARLAEMTGYTRRNVAEECDTLQRAGLLSVRTRGNRFSYSLRRRTVLESFVGELPAVRPDWTAVLNVARELATLERRAQDADLRTLPVHVRRTLDRINDDLDELDIQPPPGVVVGSELWPAVHRLGKACLGAWSSGRWPASSDEDDVLELRSSDQPPPTPPA